ncbi:30S ribosomal protein S6 [Mycoplasma phocoeninasale]|uniref:Small ribosomal subunit protein bS6 n=1 Tax=Mycoplasma phocoeninasale TaxID=2726117 RepID=A0A858U5P9_9MOLU|nr:30S ribosomal protein S6 [Mycoplasma phocoeninasale]MBN0970912.1 30S ribosomal protein S6 [Mycoplasma phocoeninasale]QJG66573.1 30S ribosomal protein S6 [Mycoplasma phocoeninasale]
MSNYEIMILVDPAAKEEDFTSLVFSVLNEKDAKLEKLERSELAYPIKKMSRASYYLISAKAEPHLIAELTRKLNISKIILRNLIINLDSERGLKPRKVKKVYGRKPAFANNRDGKKTFPRPYNKDNTEAKPGNNEARGERKPRPRVEKSK